MTVLSGALRFDELSDAGDVTSSRIIDTDSGPQVVKPGAWHKIGPVEDALR